MTLSAFTPITVPCEVCGSPATGSEKDGVFCADPECGGSEESALCAEYTRYLSTHGLPECSADELLYGLNDAERALHGAWLSDFILRWDTVVCRAE